MFAAPCKHCFLCYPVKYFFYELFIDYGISYLVCINNEMYHVVVDVCAHTLIFLVVLYFYNNKFNNSNRLLFLLSLRDLKIILKYSIASTMP